MGSCTRSTGSDRQPGGQKIRGGIPVTVVDRPAAFAHGT